MRVIVCKAMIVVAVLFATIYGMPVSASSLIPPTPTPIPDAPLTPIDNAGEEPGWIELPPGLPTVEDNAAGDSASPYEESSALIPELAENAAVYDRIAARWHGFCYLPIYTNSIVCWGKNDFAIPGITVTLPFVLSPPNLPVERVSKLFGTYHFIGALVPREGVYYPIRHDHARSYVQGNWIDVSGDPSGTSVCVLYPYEVRCHSPHGWFLAPLSPLSPAFPQQVALAVAHSYPSFAGCVLMDTGEIYCYGSNHNGMLGLPSVVTYTTNLVKINGVPPAKSVKGGRSRICAHAVNNDLYCWGAGLSPARASLPGPVTAYTVDTDVVCAIVIASGQQQLHCAGFTIDGFTSGFTFRAIDIPSIPDQFVVGLAHAGSVLCLHYDNDVVRCRGNIADSSLHFGQAGTGLHNPNTPFTQSVLYAAPILPYRDAHIESSQVTLMWRGGAGSASHYRYCVTLSPSGCTPSISTGTKREVTINITEFYGRRVFWRAAACRDSECNTRGVSDLMAFSVWHPSYRHRSYLPAIYHR